MNKSYSDIEARELAVAAAREALARFRSDNPLPTSVSVADAAEMLGVSTRTVSRLKLPRNKVGRIPYSAILDALASR